jgi:hypothetical protein
MACVSCSSSALFHMRPPSRTTQGMLASTITSLGTCRLVMFLRESTMASAGRAAKAAAMSASTAARAPSGAFASLASTSPNPLFWFTPSSLNSAPCLAHTGAKNTVTAWPNRMGSEIFIMVALRCSEASTPSALAAAKARS